MNAEKQFVSSNGQNAMVQFTNGVKVAFIGASYFVCFSQGANYLDAWISSEFPDETPIDPGLAQHAESLYRKLALPGS